MEERLIILEESRSPREVRPARETLEIGRSRHVQVVLEDRSVSRRHAVLRRHDDRLFLEDVGSTFGTFVNGRSMAPGKPVTLRDGDVVEFGRAQMLCRFDQEPLSLREATRDVAFAAQANARLVVLDGEHVRRIPVATPATLIGCARHCDVRLGDETGPPEHARIRAVEGAFRLEPRSWTDPPRLDGNPLVVGEAALLSSNSVFVVHQSQILFLYDFHPDRVRVHDPLSVIPRRRLLRHVAELCNLSYRELKKTCRRNRVVGQNLGEILVTRGWMTPLLWRVACEQLLCSAQTRRWWHNIPRGG